MSAFPAVLLICSFQLSLLFVNISLARPHQHCGVLLVSICNIEHRTFPKIWVGTFLVRNVQGLFSFIFYPNHLTPLLKKPGLDSSSPSNYRRISNLNNISKILERLFLTVLQPHVTSCPNFNPLQSAYRRAHSTETALVNTLDYIYTSAGRSLPTISVSLDLSAAFDTIDHCTLLNRLENSFGVTGLALSWIRSCLSNRSQCVAMKLPVAILGTLY